MTGHAPIPEWEREVRVKIGDAVLGVDVTAIARKFGGGFTSTQLREELSAMMPWLDLSRIDAVEHDIFATWPQLRRTEQEEKS